MVGLPERLLGPAGQSGPLDPGGTVALGLRLGDGLARAVLGVADRKPRAVGFEPRDDPRTQPEGLDGVRPRHQVVEVPRAGVRQRITQTEVLNAAPHRVLRIGHRARIDLCGPGSPGGPGLLGGGGCLGRGRRRVLPGFDPATGLLHSALPPLRR